RKPLAPARRASWTYSSRLDEVADNQQFHPRLRPLSGASPCSSLLFTYWRHRGRPTAKDLLERCRPRAGGRRRHERGTTSPRARDDPAVIARPYVGPDPAARLTATRPVSRTAAHDRVRTVQTRTCVR